MSTESSSRGVICLTLPYFLPSPVRNLITALTSHGMIAPRFFRFYPAREDALRLAGRALAPASGLAFIATL
jgi:hypothetical protein